jgi:hypothetical protein
MKNCWGQQKGQQNTNFRLGKNSLSKSIFLYDSKRINSANKQKSIWERKGIKK